MKPFRKMFWAALLIAQSGAAQVPLSIDTMFRVDLAAEGVASVLPVEDGRLIISGNLEIDGPFEPESGARLLNDGQFDPTFFQGFQPMGGKLTRWNDRYYSGNGPGMRRFFMDGTLDTSFDMIGTEEFMAFQGGDYHVFPDGRVLFSGYHELDDPAHGFTGLYNLIWFTSEGALDTTRVHRASNGTIWRIKQYPAGTSGGLGGKFLVHTWGNIYEGQPVKRVFRVHEDGALDGTFEAPIEWGVILSIVPLPDGRAYLGGLFTLENEPDTMQLIRVLADGSLDPTFNQGLDFNKPDTTYDVDASVLCIYPIGPGLLALTGNFNEVDGHERSSICIIDTLGNVVDQYLDGAGCSAYDYPIGMTVHTYSIIQGINQDFEGDYYIWGAYHGYTDGTTNDTLQRMVTRLHGGEIGLGVSPPLEGSATMLLYPNPSSGNATLQVEQMQSDAQLVVHDALGREVYRQWITTYTTTIPAPHPGLYMVVLWSNGERIATERWVCE